MRKVVWILVLVSSACFAEGDPVGCVEGNTDLDLSAQFPMTRDQGYATCYAHSGLGLVSAYISRNAGQKKLRF